MVGELQFVGIHSEGGKGFVVDQFDVVQIDGVKNVLFAE